MLPESPRDFSEQYSDDPEAGMRAAMAFLVSTASVPAKHLAAELGESPSEFSRMTATIPSEDANHRRHLPLGKLIRAMKFTGNLSPLHTALGYLGYNPARLQEISRPVKTPAQLLESIESRLESREREDREIRAQLKLVLQEPGTKRRAVKGRENVYTCPECGGYTVTVDVDDGVTPFLLGCRAGGRVGDCKGMAESAFYPNGPRPAHIPPPAWEWYKPTTDEFNQLSPGMKDHVRNGGLNIRRKPSAGPEGT